MLNFLRLYFEDASLITLINGLSGYDYRVAMLPLSYLIAKFEIDRIILTCLNREKSKTDGPTIIIEKPRFNNWPCSVIIRYYPIMHHYH